jgi:hypothetical protein
VKITAEEFNKKYPIGTKVKYFHYYGGKEFKECETTSEAWTLGHNEPVVKLSIGAGGYYLRNIKIARKLSDKSDKQKEFEA